MANFWSDLNRHIASYEEGERMDEIEREMTAEADPWHVYGEAADIIPAEFVWEPWEPAWYTDGQGRFVYRAGEDMDPWGRDGIVVIG